MEKRIRKKRSIEISVFIFAILVLGLILPLIPDQNIQRPTPQLMWNGQPFRPVGINYYPSNDLWELMWERFNATEITHDMSIVRSLGGNCIRSLIQWPLVEPEYGVFNTTILQRIVQLFQICSNADIAIIFSFFNGGPPRWANASSEDAMYIQPDLIAREIAQIQTVISLVNTTKAAFMWDLQNEPSSLVLTMSQFRQWVADLTSAIHQMGDTHLITVGGGYQNLENPAGYADLVDAVCCHFYHNQHEPEYKRFFQNYIKMFQATGKPVILEEFGLPTLASQGYTEQMQAEEYRVILTLCDKDNLAGVLPWCLYNYPSLVNSTEGHNGLLRADGTWKPAAYVFHEYAMGTMKYASNIQLEEF